MPILKHCPFCGSEARIVTHIFEFVPSSYGVVCCGCKAESWQFFDNEEEAANAWNTRVCGIEVNQYGGNAKYIGHVETIVIGGKDGKKKMNWISVHDRLPEKSTVVIAAIYESDIINLKDGKTIQQADDRLRRLCRRITLAYRDDDGWVEFYRFPAMVHPAYWMPLPELPEVVA